MANEHNFSARHGLVRATVPNVPSTNSFESFESFNLTPGHCHWARETKHSRNSTIAASHNAPPALFASFAFACFKHIKSVLVSQRIL